MGKPESTIFSFVVKIWVERIAGRPRNVRWHGTITHIPSGDRQYFRRLRDIPALIAPHLEALGIRPGRLERLRRWLWRLAASRRRR